MGGEACTQIFSAAFLAPIPRSPPHLPSCPEEKKKKMPRGHGGHADERGKDGVGDAHIGEVSKKAGAKTQNPPPPPAPKPLKGERLLEEAAKKK